MVIWREIDAANYVSCITIMPSFSLVCSELQIEIFRLCTRNRAVLDALILEAKKAYMSAREDKIDIFVNQG